MTKKTRVCIDLTSETIEWIDEKAKYYHMSRKQYLEFLLELSRPVYDNFELMLQKSMRQIPYPEREKLKAEFKKRGVKLGI